MFRAFIASLLVFASAAAVVAEDWPQFRGPTGLGYTAAKKLPVEWGGKDNKNVLWSASLKGEGHASPIIAGKLVVVCNVSWPVKKNDEMPTHFVTAYDLATGDEVWSKELKPGPWVRNDFRSGPGGGYAAPTPCTDGKFVYCLFGSAVMAALRWEDGEEVWRKEIRPYTFDVTIGSSPILYQDTLLVLCAMAKKEDSRLVAFHKSTGEVKWETKLPTVGFGHSTPVLVEVKGAPQLILAASGGSDTADALQAFDPNTGERLWWCKGAGEASSPAFDAKTNVVYFDSGRGSAGTAVDATGKGDVTGTHIQWTVGAVPEAIGSPIIVAGRVYRLNSPNILKCWNLADGEPLFTERLKEITSTWISPIADAEGRVYFVSAGKSYVIDSGDKFKLLAINDLGDANHASPAVNNDKLYLVGQKKLWCIGTK